MKFYYYHWAEIREDKHGHWGTSDWYFEIDDQGFPNRQVEIYQNGKVLKYSRQNSDDAFGGLGDQALETDMLSGNEITKEKFENKWKA